MRRNRRLLAGLVLLAMVIGGMISQAGNKQGSDTVAPQAQVAMSQGDARPRVKLALSAAPRVRIDLPQQTAPSIRIQVDEALFGDGVQVIRVDLPVMTQASVIGALPASSIAGALPVGQVAGSIAAPRPQSPSKPISKPASKATKAVTGAARQSNVGGQWASSNTVKVGRVGNVTPVAVGGYKVASPPTISAQTINKVLHALGSPSYGHGQQFYDLGVKYGVDPAAMLAFYIKESRAGTLGAATVTLNIGNIICTIDWLNQGGGCSGRWRVYPSDVAAAEDWYQLISGYGYMGSGLTTVGQIVPKYAPVGDCNASHTICNDPAEYIKTVEGYMDWFRSIERTAK